MKKRFLIGLAPLLAIAAFAVVPGVAQAACISTKAGECPHYFVEGSKKSVQGAKTGVSIGWGDITLTGTAGALIGAHITCHNAAAGTLNNPEPTASEAGKGAVSVFNPFECKQEKICPSLTNKVKVIAENLPWPDLLTEEVAGVIRQETTGVKVDIICEEAGVVTAELHFIPGKTEKSCWRLEFCGQRPKGVEGTSALHPGLLEFDPGSGELEQEGSGGLVRGATSGAVKSLEYNAQGLTSLKSST